MKKSLLVLCVLLSASPIETNAMSVTDFNMPPLPTGAEMLYEIVPANESIYEENTCIYIGDGSSSYDHAKLINQERAITSVEYNYEDVATEVSVSEDLVKGAMLRAGENAHRVVTGEQTVGLEHVSNEYEIQTENLHANMELANEKPFNGYYREKQYLTDSYHPVTNAGDEGNAILDPETNLPYTIGHYTTIANNEIITTSQGISLVDIGCNGISTEYLVSEAGRFYVETPTFYPYYYANEYSTKTNTKLYPNVKSEINKI